MELRANLENRHCFPDACQEPDSVTWDINEAMHLSMDFLQSMTDIVECTDDVVREAWLDAKSFVSS